MRWQRTVRLAIAVTAVAFAIAVVFNIRRRPPQRIEQPIARTDTRAVVESAGGESVRVNREREQGGILYERLLTYADGTSKMVGVTVKTNRSGRVFTITAKEGRVGEAESTVELDGDVKVVASDGFALSTAHATYTENDGQLRAPGFVQFSSGRMRGSGMGFTYDKNRDVLSIVDEAKVRVGPDAAGLGTMDITAGALEFRRLERSIRFERTMKATRVRETIEADTAVAHLTTDEEHLEAVELRGRSRVTAAKAAAGGLRFLTGRDVDLAYAADGQALQRAVINGDAVMQLAGLGKEPGRRIAGATIELALGPDGETLTGLTAREHVTLDLPAGQNGVSRTVLSRTLEATGDASHGLTGAHFDGDVEFVERGPSVNRRARSAQLDVAVGPGFSSMSDARFVRGVRFEDGALLATAAEARYAPDRAELELFGSEPGHLTPHVVNEQIAIDATNLRVGLDGPVVNAAGAVKSVLRPRTSPAGGGGGKTNEPRVPSMLKPDQPVNITGEALDYEGRASRATYSGNTLLWQGDTTIKSPLLVVDSRKGDLRASGPVTTVATLLQPGQGGQTERVRSTGTANAFTYEDDTRRATYTGEAHLRGPQGDLAATKIELFLKPSGDELDRVEAYDAVQLRADDRKTTGLRLTYFGDEGRYLVSGTPVVVLDECARETTGRTLTFYKSTDRILVDGNEQVRTQTKGKSNCPGT